jgi:hypothetical protein
MVPEGGRALAIYLALAHRGCCCRQRPEALTSPVALAHRGCCCRQRSEAVFQPLALAQGHCRHRRMSRATLEPPQLAVPVGIVIDKDPSSARGVCLQPG